MSQVVVYTREGCHLCEIAITQLKRIGFAPRLVDIDSDPTLVSRFHTCVPVIEIDGEIRFRGRINPVLLQRLVNHTRSFGKTG